MRLIDVDKLIEVFEEQDHYLWKLPDKENPHKRAKEQTIPFEVLVHPNEEQLKKRDAFISSMEKNVTIVKMDSDGIVAEMVVKE